MTKVNPNIEPPPKVTLFATPESSEEMEDYLSKFNGNEGVVANTCAFMMYNLMCDYIQQTYHHIEETDE